MILPADTEITDKSRITSTTNRLRLNPEITRDMKDKKQDLDLNSLELQIIHARLCKMKGQKTYKGV